MAHVNNASLISLIF